MSIVKLPNPHLPNYRGDWYNVANINTWYMEAHLLKVVPRRLSLKIQVGDSGYVIYMGGMFGVGNAGINRMFLAGINRMFLW